MGGYIGAKSGVGLVNTTLGSVQDLTATDASPEVTLINNTHEDTDGGREGKVIFKGQQSGGEESTLAEIQASHDGTADDEKGDLIFRTNDGSDSASPTERLRIDSAGAIIPATLGTDTVKLGDGAGESIASGGNNNTLIGHDAGKSITTGTVNTFVGNLAGDAVTTSHHNTGVGHQALTTNVLGSNSVAVGSFALNAQNPASATDMHNTAVGYNAGVAITTATRNTAVGSLAGASNQTSEYNTYVGYGAGQSTTGQGNTFIGDASGNSVVAGEFNTLLGQQAGNAITSGDKNTVIGRYNGNQGGLDIRTSSHAIVLSDGDGVPKMFHDGGVNWFIGNYTSNAYWPAAASSSSQHGILFQNTTGALGVSTNDAIYFNKNNGDGTIVLFYSEGGLEGSISISGSTTSFNGGHLSRWSQLADGSRDNALVKGTVMTNLDQMAVWEHDAVAEGDTIKNAMGETVTATADDVADAYTEDNEQLNCMAVSSVEGDANVAGVFVNWDATDDGYNDMNIAMTGDMVIRIAQGTTVARGDLLMSAGDGTAKPQGDDIVRSKTIAKVTSTNVSHTYDDGSYLVPCVLMAC
tara:strand:- start:688 stop:2427 length:1740 start_codon:yes stop_codon:yes gene_type:complete